MNSVQGSNSKRTSNHSVSASTTQTLSVAQPPPPQHHQTSAQLTQVQLTYAQKVKSRTPSTTPVMNGGASFPPKQSSPAAAAGGPRPTNNIAATTPSASLPAAASASGSGSTPKPPAAAKAVVAPQQQYRMVPTGSLQLQASALQNYAYPYNYSITQRHRMSAQGTTATASTATNATAQRVGAAASSAASPPAASRRDFFVDRQVHSNVNHAVSRYYHYHPQSAQSAVGASLGRQSRQNTNRWAPSMAARQQQGAHYVRSFGGAAAMRGAPQRGYTPSTQRASGRGGMGQRGYPQRAGGPPSYSSSSRGRGGGWSLKNGVSHRGGRRVRAQRGKVSDSVLKSYENAADRDVLCWIYENQGQCRYGQKCQWLHLDRESGKYVPTVYMMNSLRGSDANAAARGGGAGSAGGAHRAPPAPSPTKHDDDDDDEDDDHDANDLVTKFQAMMEQKLQRKKEEELRAKQNVDQNEEDSKEDDAEPDDKGDGDPAAAQSGKGGQYGGYGTTFDRQNVCWEFNTFVGCRKGAKCKWAHAYLVRESAHPYTGEKLNGMAVRKFRQSNNI